MIIAPYYIKINGRESLFQYNGRFYPSMKDMIYKILKHKHITNVMDVCVCNMGFMKGNTFTKTRVRTAESVMPFIDPRYKSASFDMNEYESKNNGWYHCSHTVSRSLDVVFKVSQISRCHIRINTRSIVPDRKLCLVKPIVPPKSICVQTIHGCIHYKYNKLFHHIWKENWSTCDNKNFKKHLNRILKAKYITEINRFRRFSGKWNLIIHPLLNDLAQRRTDSMANHQKLKHDIEQKLISDKNKKYDELIAYTSCGYSKFLMYTLFNDAWNHNPNFDRVSIKKWEMARLMSTETRYVGIGITKRYDTVYVCVKFTRNTMYAEYH